MTATYERIIQDISTLAPEEVEALRHDLQSRATFPPQDVEEASIQVEWDAEIDQRMNEVMEGKVQLISSAESERRMDALFAKHGIQRLSA